jgi:hypothetical protein
VPVSRRFSRLSFPPHHRADAVPVYAPIIFLSRPGPRVLSQCDLDHEMAEANRDLLTKTTTPDRPPSTVDAGVGTQLRSSLDKEEIRTVIRSHLHAVRSCYERRLGQNPALKGRISVIFTIAGDGSIQSSATQSSTMHDSAVEDCLNRAVCGWRFPEPTGGGYVIVSYPFNFIP